jgi:phosphatidylserine decarboxylase
MSATSFAAAQVLRVLPRAAIGRAFGRLADHPWSPWLERTVVGAYVRVYGISFDECVQSSGWATFDEFFTRRLRPGMRQVEPDPSTVVSPSDGTIAAVASVEPGGRLVVKGRPYGVADLAGDAGAEPRFSNGVGWVIYLSPGDYHRVHAPVAGSILRIRSMAGEYYPVNIVGTRHVTNLLGRNRRVAIELDSDRGLGRVTVVMVGAMLVGRITTIGIAARDVPVGDHVFDPPIRVERGEEIGTFHFGSTVVLLVEKASRSDAVARGGVVRYGQTLVRAGDRSLGAGRVDGFVAVESGLGALQRDG